VKISDIVQRIRDECPSFQTVDSALISDASYEYPAAFVALVKTSAIEDQIRLIGYAAQIVRKTFGVYIVAPKRQDAFGDAIADEFETLAAELRAALFGWSPAGSTALSPLYLGGGEMVERQQMIQWREDFTADFDERP